MLTFCMTDFDREWIFDLEWNADRTDCDISGGGPT